jgi:hypothetical protein
MYKLASVALSTLLGVGGMACAAPANANVRAEGVVPRVVVEPFAYAPGFFPRYYGYAGWRRDYGRRWAYDWHRHGYRR